MAPVSSPGARLSQRIGAATRWRLAGSAIGALLQLAVGAVLARVLSPADFGVMALALSVLSITRPLGDLGIGNAIVQRAELTERHVRTGFTVSVLFGVVLAGIVALTAPLGSLLMQDASVAPVLRVLSLGFLVGGAATVPGALLRRQLDFKRPFIVETASYLAGYGGVALVLAQSGFGVWSLVWGGLTQTLLSTVAQVALVGLPRPPALGAREAADLLHVGLGMTLNGCVNILALNADNLVVGRWLGPAPLGLYSRAYTLMTLPLTHAAHTLSSVLFPAFALVQGDRERLRRGYLLATRVTALVAAPAMVTLGIGAPHLVHSLYGAQWIGAVAPLQVLCVAGYFRALYHLCGAVVQAVGWVYRELRRQAVYAILTFGGALAGASYGLAGVAAGVGVAILYMYFAQGSLALQATGTSWRDYFRVQIGALGLAAVTAAAALVARFALEGLVMSSAAIAIGVLIAAALPWSIGILWTLGNPEFGPVRASLPQWCQRLIAGIRPNVR